MAILNENGEWMDSRGNWINPEHIDPVVKRRDRDISRVVKSAIRLQKKMIADKKRFQKIIDQYEAYIAKRYKAKADKKGNVQRQDYAGKYRIEYELHNVLEFDDRIHTAKSIIDECLMVWGASADVNLKTVVNHAFKVDKKGKINTKSILELTRYNIKDKRWREAMQLIEDSKQIVDRKPYLRFAVRDADGKWQTVNLNFSTL